MPDINSILNDPNYINANPATKQAIFDRHIGRDPNYLNANEATKSAIRAKFGIGGKPLSDLGRDIADIRARSFENPFAMPSQQEERAINAAIVEGQKARAARPVQQRVWEDVARPALQDIVPVGGQMVGEVLGGLQGATIGSVVPGAGTIGGGAIGAVAGGGLGYALGEELMRLGDSTLGGPKTALLSQQMANAPQWTPGKEAGQVLSNFLTGAGYSMAGPLINKGIARGRGFLTDAGSKIKGIYDELGPGAKKAGNILREAAAERGAYDQDILLQRLGSVDRAKSVLKAYSENPASVSAQDVVDALKFLGQNEGATTSQLIAGMNRPTLQAALAEGAAYSPAERLAATNRQQGEISRSLAEVAGSTSQTGARTLAESQKAALNEAMSPVREAAFAQGNLGRAIPDLEAQSAGLDQAANRAVAEARRFNELGNIASEHARLDLINQGMPVEGIPYTYKGELAGMAENWTGRAADKSLELGWGSREAGNLASGLRESGVSPVMASDLVGQIRGLLDIDKYPDIGGSSSARGLVEKAVSEIERAAGRNGTLSMEALDAIRKNVVSDFLDNLPAGLAANKETGKRVAMELKPILANAIEAAGGTGYKTEYLPGFAKGMEDINRQRLVAHGNNLWNSGERDKFVQFIRGADDKVVEEIMGTGKFDIAKELPEQAMKRFQEVARQHLVDMKANEEIGSGRDALLRLLAENVNKFRAPWALSRAVSLGNKGLEWLEAKMNRNVMDQLTRAANDPAHLRNLLEALPAVERVRVLSILDNPKTWEELSIAERIGARVPGAAMTRATDNKLEDR